MEPKINIALKAARLAGKEINKFARRKDKLKISDVKDVVKAHVLSLTKPNVGGRRLIIGSEVKKLIEL